MSRCGMLKDYLSLAAAIFKNEDTNITDTVFLFGSLNGAELSEGRVKASKNLFDS